MPANNFGRHFLFYYQLNSYFRRVNEKEYEKQGLPINIVGAMCCVVWQKERYGSHQR